MAPFAEGAFIQSAFIAGLLRARSHVACAHTYTQLPWEALAWCGSAAGQSQNKEVWGFSADKPEVVVSPACGLWERSQEHDIGGRLDKEPPLGVGGVRGGPQPDTTLTRWAHCSVSNV